MKKIYKKPISTCIDLSVESPLMGNSKEPPINTDGPVVGGGGSDNLEELTQRQHSIWDYWTN